MVTVIDMVIVIGMEKNKPSTALDRVVRKGRHQEFDGGEFVGVHDPEVLPLALLALQIALHEHRRHWTPHLR